MRFVRSTVVGLVCRCLVFAAIAHAEQFKSLARHMSNREAAAAGRQLGIGTTTLKGPKVVEVSTHNTWTLVYTAGKAGIAPGGGIRIAMRHMIQWSPPQTETPQADGYLTIETDNDVPARAYIEYNKYGKKARLFDQYHPWQNIVEVTLPKRRLCEGESIRVTYGDRRGGSQGIRVQPFDESPFTFKVYVDPLGDGEYLPLIDNPTIDIVAAKPYRLGIVMPSDAAPDKPTWCIVRAEDRYGNPAATYRGTVRLTTGCDKAELPLEYTFSEIDRGVHRFDDIVFGRLGTFTVTVTDGTFKRTGNPVRVAPARDRLLLWGDLHGHTLNSDGRGTVEQFYDFAERVAGLDFCAASDHAFEMTAEMWEHSKRVTNGVYEPGRFVTFHAYEWSGQCDVGGDHNVYFLEDDPPIYRSRSYYNYCNLQMYHGSEPQVNHVEDLFATLTRHLKNKNILTIPHYGGRRANPAWHNPEVQRAIEVFSEHRRSEDWMTPFLKKRYRLGIIASSDGHFGNPGYGYLKPTYDWDTQEIGMALVAVYAKARTREAIFEALYDRHVYATSGERIILDVHADGHRMGSEYKTTTSPMLGIQVIGTAPIIKVQIKKNSEVVYATEPNQTAVTLQWQDPDFNPATECYYYVRVVQANNEEAISSPVWIN